MIVDASAKQIYLCCLAAGKETKGLLPFGFSLLKGHRCGVDLQKERKMLCLTVMSLAAGHSEQRPNQQWWVELVDLKWEPLVAEAADLL